MIVDGKKIAEEIFSETKNLIETEANPLCLTVFACAPNKETKKFLELKKRRASELGLDVMMFEFDDDVDTEGVISNIQAVISKSEGIIVQLPFPPHIDIDAVLAIIPKELDVDMIHYSGELMNILPPVVGAIAEITKRHEVIFTNKNVVVVGHGRLVGKPAALWAKAQSAAVTVIDKDTKDAEEILRNADIIISGAGVPGLITPDKVKDGVIIFDAGTSEEGGQLRGDADPACAGKSSLFTPVPGGIGPITIAILLRNHVVLGMTRK